MCTAICIRAAAYFSPQSSDWSIVPSSFFSLTDSHILSDERAQQIINKALQSGSLKQRNVTLTGLSGSGKTSFLSRLFHTQPPELYTSTGIVGQSFRGLLHQISNISLGTWEILSHTDVLEFLAPLFLAGMTEANVASLATDFLTMDASNLTTSAQVSLPSPLSSSSTGHSKLQSPPTEEKSTEKASIKEEIELISVIDTGGHSECIEFMPSIINDAHLTVLLVNLMYGLDEHPPIHVKGVSYKRNMLSWYTTEQIIKKLVVTLQAKRSSHIKVNLFRILVVATHRDCVVSDLDARVEALNQQLRNLLLPSCEEELICYSSDQIPFVLNLKDPDVQDEKTLELIRSKVSGSNLGTVIEIPGSFLKYEQHLLKYAAKVERGSLSLGECLLVGKELKMKDEEVKAALVFFHHHHTFLYFREVLPNLIFVKPQVALDFVNAIVLFSYKVGAGVSFGFPAKFSSYLKEGIITEEMLSHDELSTCFIQGLYEPSHAIEILCHIFMLAPLDHEKRNPKTSSNSPQPNARMSLAKEKKYLMTCQLPAIPDHELRSHVPSSPKMTPLVVKFTGGCVPLGCFSSTISCLLSTYEWRVSRNEDDSPECLACNIASLFCPTDAFLLKVVLVDSSDYIEVYVDADEDVLNVLPEVRQTILGAIGKVLDTMHLSEVDALPAVLCPCKKVYQFHPASLIEVNSEKFLYCPKAKLKVGTPHEKQTMWFGDNPLQNGRLCF